MGASRCNVVMIAVVMLARGGEACSNLLWLLGERGELYNTGKCISKCVVGVPNPSLDICMGELPVKFSGGV